MAEVYLASLAIQIEPLGNSVQACTQCEICRTAESFSFDKRLGKLEIQARDIAMLWYTSAYIDCLVVEPAASP
jgi:hypothetical protein